jgi:hypothetical protein
MANFGYDLPPGVKQAEIDAQYKEKETPYKVQVHDNGHWVLWNDYENDDKAFDGAQRAFENGYKVRVLDNNHQIWES